MFKKVLGTITIMGGMLVFFSNPVTTFADNLADEIAKGNPQVSEPIISNSSDLEITPETQSLIDNYVAESSGNQDTINEIIENCKQSGIISSQEMNKAISDFILSATIDPTQLEEALVSANELVNTSESRVSTSRAAVDPIKLARSGWAAGIAIVRNEGYPNTAMYMKYAEVPSFLSPSPAKHVSNGNAWAKNVVSGNDILGSFYSEYKAWVRGTSKTKTIKGTFAFTSGDKYYALHNVKYSYSFVRQSNGSVKTTGVVTDVYDFAPSNYESIKVGFANNYAYAMQSLGLIKPFNIEIKHSF